MVETCWNPINNGINWDVYHLSGARFRWPIHSITSHITTARWFSVRCPVQAIWLAPPSWPVLCWSGHRCQSQIWISRDWWGWKYGSSGSWEFYWVESHPSIWEIKIPMEIRWNRWSIHFISGRLGDQIDDIPSGNHFFTKFLWGEPRWIRQQHLGFHNGQFIVDSLHLLLHLKWYPRGHRTAEILAAVVFIFSDAETHPNTFLLAPLKNYSCSRKQHGSATISFFQTWLRWRLNCQVLSLLVEILKFAALICSFLGCKSLGFRTEKRVAKPCCLVVQ